MLNLGGIVLLDLYVWVIMVKDRLSSRMDLGFDIMAAISLEGCWIVLSFNLDDGRLVGSYKLFLFRIPLTLSGLRSYGCAWNLF